MNKDPLVTILDLVPELDTSNAKDSLRKAGEIKEFFNEAGRTNCTIDEIAFIMLMEHYITVFEKAKSMIAQDRFTVRYVGDKTQENPKLTDFKIINI
jgi:hypothetical protein